MRVFPLRCNGDKLCNGYRRISEPTILSSVSVVIGRRRSSSGIPNKRFFGTMGYSFVRLVRDGRCAWQKRGQHCGTGFYRVAGRLVRFVFRNHRAVPKHKGGGNLLPPLCLPEFSLSEARPVRHHPDKGLNLTSFLPLVAQTGQVRGWVAIHIKERQDPCL